MDTEAACPHHPFLLSPKPHHLAELRMEPAHSAIAFSAPCSAVGRKRRCLLPASSPRKKMLLELPPFGSAPAPSPSSSLPPSPRQCSPTPAIAPPSTSRGAGSPGSGFSFPSALAWTGGGGGEGEGCGGSIFSFVEKTVTTPSPDGSNASAFSFLASPGHPVTPTVSTASGGVTFLASPKQPTTPTAPTANGCFSFLASPERPTTPSAGPTASGGFAFLASPKQPTTPTGPAANGSFMFMASPEQPLMPTGSIASGGLAFLSSEPSLSPREYKVSGAVASLPSPKPARTGSTDSGGFAFFHSPGPAFGHTVSAQSPSFVFSAPRTSVSPMRKSGGGSKKRSWRHLRLATARHRSQRQWQEPQQVTPPLPKVAKTGALATGEASRTSILSGSSAKPCCTFFTSPAKADKQEAKKASSEASRSSSPYRSPAGSRCTFVMSPARPSSAEKASKREREVEVSSVAREGPTSPAACTGAEMVVRVTCTCGVQKEFCFDHFH